MIEYLRGPLAELTPAMAVVECGGIGYDVNITLMDYSSLQGKEAAKLYILECNNQREGVMDLYGFLERRARDIFEMLISVRGCGAGSARLILSAMTPADVERVIAKGDTNALKAVKGIGTKTAERIIVDLRDKIKTADEALLTQATSASAAGEEAVQALVMLGFPKPQSEKAVAKLLAQTPQATAEQLIKNAFTLL